MIRSLAFLFPKCTASGVLWDNGKIQRYYQCAISLKQQSGRFFSQNFTVPQKLWISHFSWWNRTYHHVDLIVRSLTFRLHVVSSLMLNQFLSVTPHIHLFCVFAFSSPTFFPLPPLVSLSLTEFEPLHPRLLILSARDITLVLYDLWSSETNFLLPNTVEHPVFLKTQTTCSLISLFTKSMPVSLQRTIFGMLKSAPQC